jgi:hypothetical protein
LLGFFIQGNNFRLFFTKYGSGYISVNFSQTHLVTLHASFIRKFRPELTDPVVVLEVVDERPPDGDGKVEAVGQQEDEPACCRPITRNLLPDVIQAEADAPRVDPAAGHRDQVLDIFPLTKM